MKKKALLIISFALAAVLVISQAGFAAESKDNSNTSNMMNGNGNDMSQMMQMMGSENMSKMMDAMSSPEGQNMMNACSTFMDSYGAKNDDTKENAQN